METPSFFFAVFIKFLKFFGRKLLGAFCLKFAYKSLCQLKVVLIKFSDTFEKTFFCFCITGTDVVLFQLIKIWTLVSCVLWEAQLCHCPAIAMKIEQVLLSGMVFTSFFPCHSKLALSRFFTRFQNFVYAALFSFEKLFIQTLFRSKFFHKSQFPVYRHAQTAIGVENNIPNQGGPVFSLPYKIISLEFWNSKKSVVPFFEVFVQGYYLFDWRHPALQQNLALWKICEKAEIQCTELFTRLILTCIWNVEEFILAALLTIVFPG